MSISVLICTMNRPADLQKAIDSLLACDPAPDEIIVSDDSPSGDLRSAELCERYTHVKYQRGPTRGLGANRNAAIQASRGDWVHFIDDDVKVPPQFYCLAHDIIRGADRCTILAGNEKRFGLSDTFVLVEPPRGTFWGYMESAGSENPDCVVINAAIFPRSLFDAVLFDERLRYGCEEIDLTRHAINSGYNIQRASQLCVEHYPSLENRSTYASFSFASVVYSGLKFQFFFRGSTAATICFLVFAVPRMLFNNVRKEGFAVLPILIRQTIQGLSYFLGYWRTRSESLAT